MVDGFPFTRHHLFFGNTLKKTFMHPFAFHLTKPRLSLALMTAFIFTGCAHQGSTAEALSTVKPQERWQATVASPANGIQSTIHLDDLSPWWERFNDSELNRLVKIALERNNSLIAAGFKLKQAQLQAGLASNNQMPSLSGSASSSANRSLGAGSASSHSNSVGVSVSYELDLWGKLARATDQKTWEAQATEQDLRSTQYTIAASVARLYWQLGSLTERIALGEASIAYAQQTLNLVQVQFRAGAVSQLEVVSAEKSLSSQQSAQADVIDQREQARHALAILFDASPTQRIAPEPQYLSRTAMPELAIGLPAELLARRPDLSAAELRLRSTMAAVDVARANFYPSFTLTGSVNGSNSNLSKIVSDPVGALALNLALPFLNWNENQLSLKVSKAAYGQAVAEFRQTMYTALSDVENALSARTLYDTKTIQLQQQQALAKKAEHLYEVRYRAGAASLKEWLDAQEDNRQAQINALTNRYNAYNNQVTLYLALGGAA